MAVLFMYFSIKAFKVEYCFVASCVNQLVMQMEIQIR